MEIKKELLFEKTPIPKAVMQLSIPTVMSNLVMVLYNMADTFFVGMLNDPVQNASVTLAAPVLLAYNAIINLFGVGSASMMGRALGRKDMDTVRRSSAVGFWGAMLSSIAFSLLVGIFTTPLLHLLGATEENLDATRSYLFWTATLGAAPSIVNVVLSNMVRTEGQALHASIGSMSGCLLNILLDPIFILPWGFNMGAAGAGLATLISNCIAFGYYLLLLFIKKKTTMVCLNPRMALPKKRIVTGICAVGIPASIQNLLNVTGMTVLNNFAAVYGSAAVAAMGICSKINSIPMYIAMGMSQGIMPLTSYNFGSRNIARVKEALLFTGKVALSFLATMTLVYYLFAPDLVRLFMNDDTIVNYGGRFLQGMCFATPFLCLDFLCVAAFQASGKGILSLIFAVLRKIVLEIPAIILLNSLFPLYGLAYSQFAAEFILSFIAVIVLVKMLKRMEREYALEKC